MAPVHRTFISLSKDFDAYQIHQQIQIEEETLKFLRRCRKFKRPPQSIRISGANVIEKTEKLRLFSNFETTLLEHQIKVKEERIKKLRDDAKGTPFLKLPIVDRKKLYRHYKKKLKFYGMQDNTKWQSWPAKTPLKKDQQHSLGKKNKNYKKRVARRTRQTKKDAEKALNSGAVVVLVEEEVPLGAIAALGKGLGYVPTPTSDNSDERLQMRRVVNRILGESRKRCTEESAQYTDEIPAKLRSISYSLRAPAPDKQVNTMVDR